MAGEGRGHAIRARVIVDQLCREHSISLFAPGDAYDLVAPVYAGTSVKVHRIPGLRFCYTSGRLDFVRTTKSALGYLGRMPKLLGWIERKIRDEQPDLVITDFEPALPRAARRCGVPFISLNHQHFLVVNDLSNLPRALRWSATLMGLIVRGYYSGQVETIVSSFYSPPLKHWYSHVRQIGVLLRSRILNARRERGEHLLAYIRKAAFPNVLESLRQCGRPVRIYGLGKRPDEGQLEFREIDEQRFVEDMASAEAVVTTAGNQLVGEALYLNKPVFAMPESNNFEQSINAYFLEQSGMGMAMGLEQVSAKDVRQFLARTDEFRSCIRPESIDGTPEALRAVRRHLPVSKPHSADGSLVTAENWEAPVLCKS